MKSSQSTVLTGKTGVLSEDWTVGREGDERRVRENQASNRKEREAGTGKVHCENFVDTPCRLLNGN